MNAIELKADVLSRLESVDKIVTPDLAPSPEDMEGIIGHGIELSNAIGTMAKLLADAKLVYNLKELEFMQANEDLYERPTILTKKMSASLAHECALVTWADRLMAACTHKMDFYRSIVSKYKEELRMNNTFKQQ